MFPLDYMRRIRLLQAPDAATALHCPSVPLRASGLKSRPMPASCGVAGEDIGHGCRRTGKYSFPCGPADAQSSQAQSPVH